MARKLQHGAALTVITVGAPAWDWQGPGLAIAQEDSLAGLGSVRAAGTIGSPAQAIPEQVALLASQLIDGRSDAPIHDAAILAGINAGEFQCLVDAGMTPIQAIQPGTRVRAELLGWDDRPAGATCCGNYRSATPMCGNSLESRVPARKSSSVAPTAKDCMLTSPPTQSM